MSTYVSTRGRSTASLAEALFKGLAPDGGLFMPDPLPSFGLLRDQRPTGADFVETAVWGAQRLLGGAIGDDTSERITRAALSFPVPVVEVEDDVYVLELFHGPSHAFKDVGARFMAHLMAALEPPNAVEHSRTVLVATSGDTGGAVAGAFHGMEGYRVVALFPKDGISERQRRQMSTLGANISAVAVDGTFDDCQRLAKESFSKESMCERHRLTSANSINVGRLLPQSLYYLHAWAQMPDHPIRFVVPSGNLGNLCAGLLAQRAGMPVSGFLAASNHNDVFPRFLSSDVFEAAPSVPSLSNAMDVGDPSNLERIRWLFRDSPDALRGVVRGAAVSDSETVACVREVYQRTGYVLDPHSAVAYRAQERHHDAGEGPTVVLATAHPAKFPEVVEPAIGRTVEVPEGIAKALDAAEHFAEIDATLESLESLLSTVRTDG